MNDVDIDDRSTGTEQKFFFKEKRSKVSWDTDPYNALFRARSSSHNLSHSFEEEHNDQLNININNNYTVWTNGNTAIFSKSTQMHQTTEAAIGSEGTTTSAAPAPAPVNIQLEKIRLDLASGAPTNKNISLPSFKNKSENEFRDSVIAGSAAGVTSCLLFHPFDVVRTKMQTSTRLTPATATASATASAGTSAASASTLLSTTSANSATKMKISSSSGPMAVISHTIKNGGIRAFYTGISLPLAAQAAYKATVFTTNRLSTNMLVDFKTKEQWKTGIFTPYKTKMEDHFLCGATSGAVNALLFVSPVEFARNQLIAQHTRIAEGTQSKASVMMHGPIDVMKSTLRTKGIFGLWRGVGVTLVRDSIGCGTFFVCFELGKKHLPSITGSKPDSVVTTTGAGLMAGFGYWAISLPLDALKTMVQTGMAKSATGIISTLVRRDGLIGGVSQLYRGWQLAFGRGSPSAAITLSTYAAVYNFCDKNF
jgi:solute carrier family 25 carnitine/acylcarnitine transporter 20/29